MQETYGDKSMKHLTRDKILELKTKHPTMTLREIGKRVGVSFQRVQQILKEMGFANTHKELDKKIGAAFRPNMTSKELSDASGCGRSTAYRWLLERDLIQIPLTIEEKAYQACGHRNWLKCVYCKEWDKPKNLYHNEDSEQPNRAYHRDCHASAMNRYRTENIEHAREYGRNQARKRRALIKLEMGK